jgi:hypothetical protein
MPAVFSVFSYFCFSHEEQVRQSRAARLEALLVSQREAANLRDVHVRFGFTQRGLPLSS